MTNQCSVVREISVISRRMIRSRCWSVVRAPPLRLRYTAIGQVRCLRLSLDVTGTHQSVYEDGAEDEIAYCACGEPRNNEGAEVGEVCEIGVKGDLYRHQEAATFI